MRKALLVWLAVIPAVQAELFSDPGTTGFNFLKVEAGARPAGMGGAFVSMADDLNSLWWNPAGLAGITRRTVMTYYCRYWLDVQSGQAGYAQPIKDKGVVGGCINYDYYGKNEGRDEDGEPTGNFGVSSLYLTSTYATRVKFLDPVLSYKQETAVGVSLKMVYMKIDTYYGLGLATEAGIRHKIFYNKGLVLGLALQNLGVQVKPFISERDPLPLTLRVGGSYPPKYLPLTISLDLVAPIDTNPYLSVGGEFQLIENKLYLRGGFSTHRLDWKISQEEDTFVGAALGVGFKVNQFEIDYAFTPSGQLGSINRFSFVGAF
jgi:hypothetical protein